MYCYIDKEILFRSVRWKVSHGLVFYASSYVFYVFLDQSYHFPTITDTGLHHKLKHLDANMGNDNLEAKKCIHWVSIVQK